MRVRDVPPLLTPLDMNPALIAAMNFMMNGFKKTPKEKPSKEFTEEVKKVNEMSLFEAINYVKTK
jgi:hypothetical protein